MCGIFGIKPYSEAANLTYLGLYALQHRGQESTGIASLKSQHISCYRRMGLVADVFKEETLRELAGSAAIGHVRYSTSGDSHLQNAQPILITCHHGQIALAHNGNLVNAQEIRRELGASGSIFNSSSDSEVILHLIARSQKERIEDAIIEALSRVRGAYSCVFLTENKMIAVRDPHGFRPLLMGSLGDAKLFASERCAFDLIDATFERELAPGEMAVVDNLGLVTARKPFPTKPSRQCIFEHIYFARPDGTMFGESTHAYRQRLGEKLADESHVPSDVIVPVPDSGVCAALGYAKESDTPFAFGLIRNHYVGRTFIEPKQSIRHFGVKVKLNPVRELIEGKRVVLIDDSLVRGTTSRKIVKMVRNAGAHEVHVRISAPPTAFPCYYGIDTPTRRELIASSHTVEEIRRYIEADSLAYISMDGMMECLSQSRSQDYCHACFSGDYSVPFPEMAAMDV